MTTIEELRAEVEEIPEDCHERIAPLVERLAVEHAAMLAALECEEAASGPKAGEKREKTMQWAIRAAELLKHHGWDSEEDTPIFVARLKAQALAAVRKG